MLDSVESHDDRVADATIGKTTASYMLILGVGWTNEKPHKPTLP